MENKIHSYLFVPANKKMLSKIENVKSDAIIIDLEDAVLEDEKDNALNLVVLFLSEKKINNPVYIRINPDRIEKEIPVLSKLSVFGYMVPKVESVDNINKVIDIDKSKSIIALVETPMGIVNLPEIVKCTSVNAIAFGAEDYSTKCNIHNINENLIYQKSRIVNYCKAFNKQAIDTMSLNIRDNELYRIEAQKSKDLGFDGKLAIHPMQTAEIKNVFDEENIEYLRFIVDTYKKSKKSVLEIDGKLYEKPHIDAIKNKLNLKG